MTIKTKPKVASTADLSDCANFNLRRASRAMAQYYDAVMRPCGLKGTQFTILSALALRGPMPLSRLADALVLDRTTLTRNLRPLRARDLVADAPAADRRQRILVLTAAGRRVQAEAVPLWRQAQSGIEDAFGAERLDHLRGDLVAATDVARRLR